MELLADTEIVPPALATKITPPLRFPAKTYFNYGLIPFDYTMVQSGRWSNAKDAMPPHFAESLQEAIRLNPSCLKPISN